jgi:hypothetical protein
MRGWRAACLSTPLSDAWEPDAPEVALRSLRNVLVWWNPDLLERRMNEAAGAADASRA